MALLLALEKTWKPHLWRQNLANQTVVQVLKPREFSHAQNCRATAAGQNRLCGSAAVSPVQGKDSAWICVPWLTPGLWAFHAAHAEE